MEPLKECQNCGFDVTYGHPDNACLLHALIDCVHEGDKERLYTHTNVDALWDHVSPIIDALAAGCYEI